MNYRINSESGMIKEIKEEAWWETTLTFLCLAMGTILVCAVAVLLI